MVNLTEDFKVLNELIRTAYKLISPIPYHDDIKRLTPEFMERDYVRTPGCYIAVGDGNNNTIFPICNRYGFRDPNMIKFSLKLAKKMAEVDHVDRPNLPGTIVKLERLLSKYDRPVPKPMKQAAIKGQSTKKFKNKMWSNSLIKQEVVDLGVIYLMYKALRGLIVQFNQEEDEDKKKQLEAEIAAQKQKISIAKEKK